MQNADQILIHDKHYHCKNKLDFGVHVGIFSVVLNIQPKTYIDK